MPVCDLIFFCETMPGVGVIPQASSPNTHLLVRVDRHLDAGHGDGALGGVLPKVVVHLASRSIFLLLLCGLDQQELARRVLVGIRIHQGHGSARRVGICVV